MLKREDNEKLTQTGPGAPLGQLMRSYWQPAALVSEMPEERPVKAIRLMSEDLVLFKQVVGMVIVNGRLQEYYLEAHVMVQLLITANYHIREE